MSRNRIKIICNPQTNTLSYQFQNEQMVWMPVSQFSDLSQRQYTATNIQQSAPAILNVINTVYNPGNRGVEITFEGPDKDFTYLKMMVNDKFYKENISCGQQIVKAAIAGKRGVGKTTLIDALAKKQGVEYAIISGDRYKQYKGKSGAVEWFELEGIDLGMENIKKAEHTIDALAEQGLTLFIYCLGSSRVEQPEIQLIQHIRDHHPEISLLGILTNAVSMDDTTTAEQISRVLGMEVLPIMAKDQNTRGGVIKAFGHEDVLRAIFGGT